MEHRNMGLGYRDRRDAGSALGKALLKHRDWRRADVERIIARERASPAPSDRAAE